MLSTTSFVGMLLACGMQPVMTNFVKTGCTYIYTLFHCLTPFALNGVTPIEQCVSLKSPTFTNTHAHTAHTHPHPPTPPHTVLCTHTHTYPYCTYTPTPTYTTTHSTVYTHTHMPILHIHTHTHLHHHTQYCVHTNKQLT